MTATAQAASARSIAAYGQRVDEPGTGQRGQLLPQPGRAQPVAGARVHREQHAAGPVGQATHDGGQLGQPDGVVDVGGPVGSEQHARALGQRAPPYPRQDDRVEHRVAHDPDALVGHALAAQEAGGHLGRRQVQRGKRRDHPAVALLHRPLVERPEAGLEVHDPDTGAARGERDERRGVGVTQHEYDVRRGARRGRRRHG